jgi:hypothetical protein
MPDEATVTLITDSELIPGVTVAANEPFTVKEPLNAAVPRARIGGIGIQLYAEVALTMTITIRPLEAHET